MDLAALLQAAGVDPQLRPAVAELGFDDLPRAVALPDDLLRSFVPELRGAGLNMVQACAFVEEVKRLRGPAAPSSGGAVEQLAAVLAQALQGPDALPAPPTPPPTAAPPTPAAATTALIAVDAQSGGALSQALASVKFVFEADRGIVRRADHSDEMRMAVQRLSVEVMAGQDMTHALLNEIDSALRPPPLDSNSCSSDVPPASPTPDAPPPVGELLCVFCMSASDGIPHRCGGAAVWDLRRAASASVQPGAQLAGAWTVREVLSDDGAQGVVWDAYDFARARPVAIKVLRGDCVRQQARRFIREALLGMLVQHENVVRVFEVGQDPATGAVFIAMQRGGRSLRSLLDDPAQPRPMDAASVRRFVQQAAAGLDAIHTNRAVHRDIKPDNLLIDADGQLLVADLGAASWELDSLETRGLVPGTDLYSAPERFDSSAVDARFDVWSLGVVMHEMLTGERPFADVAAVQSSALPAAPALGSVLRRCCAKDPAARFQSAKDVAVALEFEAVQAAADVRVAELERRVAELEAIVGAGVVPVKDDEGHDSEEMTQMVRGLLQQAAGDADEQRTRSRQVVQLLRGAELSKSLVNTVGVLLPAVDAEDVPFLRQLAVRFDDGELARRCAAAVSDELAVVAREHVEARLGEAARALPADALAAAVDAVQCDDARRLSRNLAQLLRCLPEGQRDARVVAAVAAKLPGIAPPDAKFLLGVALAVEPRDEKLLRQCVAGASSLLGSVELENVEEYLGDLLRAMPPDLLVAAVRGGGKDRNLVQALRCLAAEQRTPAVVAAVTERLTRICLPDCPLLVAAAVATGHAPLLAECEGLVTVSLARARPAEVEERLGESLRALPAAGLARALSEGVPPETLVRVLAALPPPRDAAVVAAVEPRLPAVVELDDCAMLIEVAKEAHNPALQSKCAACVLKVLQRIDASKIAERLGDALCALPAVELARVIDNFSGNNKRLARVLPAVVRCLPRKDARVVQACQRKGVPV